MLPLGLSMLWETVDPEAALRERFGFDSLDAVTDWATKALDTTWGIAVAACPRMVISDQNAILWVASDRGDLVVKWSGARERFGSLDASTRLLRSLADRGIPVAAPLTAPDGLDRVVLDGPSGELSVTVLPELSGDWLDVTDRAAVLSAGACLAEVHQALGSLGAGDAFEAGPREPAPAPAGGSTAPRSGELTQTISDWLATRDHQLAPEASRRLRSLLSGAPELDDEPQLVHNDFRAANILTRDSTVVGVLDLDEVRVEHRVHDLAKASVYLGTRFTAWQPTSGDVRQALRAGYESVRPLSPAEACWFEILVVWQGLHAIPRGNDPAGWASAV
ncbi:Ser/Thr protein kinase RdoA involved in Cpx stress response, MazF antagonist [Promicromonospora umidemergens]|uniref:Phosphotransferase n=1 Tax=Promicromonospora umidemergens TaxID=629679 RepID=A0ABP8XY23_9MICO|nr:phosphotransferase [Promicromonospora umidemergens]MCP2286054.1 Ser/Thr protein kinase RdoA involved in Cpx stress response, MazF antagonist [Promicromonospora umidemergens]